MRWNHCVTIRTCGYSRGTHGVLTGYSSVRWNGPLRDHPHLFPCHSSAPRRRQKCGMHRVNRTSTSAGSGACVAWCMLHAARCMLHVSYDMPSRVRRLLCVACCLVLFSVAGLATRTVSIQLLSQLGFNGNGARPQRRNAHLHDIRPRTAVHCGPTNDECRFGFHSQRSTEPQHDIPHDTARYPARHGDHPTTGLPHSSTLTFGPPFTLTAKISGSPLRRSSSKDTCRQRKPCGTAPCRCAADRCSLRRCTATGAGGVGRAPPRLRSGTPCAR